MMSIFPAPVPSAIGSAHDHDMVFLFTESHFRNNQRDTKSEVSQQNRRESRIPRTAAPMGSMVYFLTEMWGSLVNTEKT